jgi:hypothetical protein
MCRSPHIQHCPLAGQAASDEELAQLPEKSDTVEICTVLKDLVSNRSSDVVIGTGDPSIDRALLGEIVSAKSKDELQMLAIKKMQAFEPSAALVCRRELELLTHSNRDPVANACPQLGRRVARASSIYPATTRPVPLRSSTRARALRMPAWSLCCSSVTSLLLTETLS